MIEDLLAPFQECVLHENLYYHSGHTWVNIDALEGVRIGLDDFAVKVLPQTSVILTGAPRSRIIAGRPCCWVVKDDRALPILAPLNGVILSVNSQISEQPELLYHAPYGDGWLITVKPDHLREDLSHLMFGETVSLWYQQDAAKLRRYVMSIFEKDRNIVGETLCDGGERHTNLYDMVGSKMYFEMIRTFFHGEQHRNLKHA
jgi:glycine cleavage system H lipoate-binding protein